MQRPVTVLQKPIYGTEKSAYLCPTCHKAGTTHSPAFLVRSHMVTPFYGFFGLSSTEPQESDSPIKSLPANSLPGLAPGSARFPCLKEDDLFDVALNGLIPPVRPTSHGNPRQHSPHDHREYSDPFTILSCRFFRGLCLGWKKSLLLHGIIETYHYLVHK